MIVPDWLQRIKHEYHRGRAIMFLFDFDGTLTPIVSHASQAAMPPATRLLLQGLLQQPRVSVGVISGRALFDLKRLVGLSDIYLAGSGGMEIELQHCIQHYPATIELELTLLLLQHRLQTLLSRYPGSWVERKPFSLSVHYREVSTELHTALLQEVEESIEPLKLLQARTVSLAYEISPADFWDKGTAIRLIREDWLYHQHTTPLLVYCGDAENDLEAMQATHEYHGITIGIGPDAPSIAQYRLPSPADLASFLTHLHRAFVHNNLAVCN